jgi:CII-binding regulator of phage lambda lysogenization HflD
MSPLLPIVRRVLERELKAKQQRLDQLANDIRDLQFQIEEAGHDYNDLAAQVADLEAFLAITTKPPTPEPADADC